MWYEKSLVVCPNSSEACAGLGEVFYLAELDEQSKAMFEWALKSNSENEVARRGLAKVNGLLGLRSDHNSLCENASLLAANSQQLFHSRTIES